MYASLAPATGRSRLQEKKASSVFKMLDASNTISNCATYDTKGNLDNLTLIFWEWFTIAKINDLIAFTIRGIIIRGIT